MAELTDDELLAELGVTVAPKKAGGLTPREDRIIAGFEEILRFHDENGRAPLYGEERDIFERLYAIRLDRLRVLPESRNLLAPYDKFRMLDATATLTEANPDELDDAALLAELGVDATSADDISVLRHVVTREEKRAAEEIANRTPCEDFENFKPLFEKVRIELDTSVRQTRNLDKAEMQLADIRPGEWFVVGGQIAYIASAGDEFVTEYERKDRRLRVVYDNATESNVLARSLQKALYRDGAGRRITNPSAGPLFGDEAEDDDLQSGMIYVLRSKSELPEIAKHRQLIHKIGVTGGSVEARITQAAQDPTYLLADVEIVATYKLFNINRTRLENIFHRLFGAVRIDLSIADRFGQPVKPREWFLVPLHVIDQAVEKIKDGSITEFVYDPKTASLQEK
ncbi:GIY-YIG nuclease family protein [Tardiphaga sp. vice352]|uniref:GIY-YIG nuclease family protein n=1 Tax=Tardiphaga sp. vice352 TaxID=2592816 RepID=UPI0011623819|nr:GIY-YIG nuclease family protein [Tardiphaga sp. vice352]QDM32866.1 GIY-YIG nuclease family protein [Tardiphaga sp. vice352]